MPLSAAHDTTAFDCNNATLDEWLSQRALKNESSGGSRTFVICQKNQVIGYYALASGSVERIAAPKTISRNMPEPIPVMVLGRLAIHQNHQRQGLGSALLKDALLRSMGVAGNVGVRAVLVHAISSNAKQFYQRYGFIESRIDSMTLMLAVNHIRALL